MIYLGSNEISGIKLGNTDISAIYAGDLLIYPMDFGNLTAITIEDLAWETDVPYTGGTATSANCSFNVYGLYDSGKRKSITAAATITGSLEVSATTSETRENVGTLTLTASYSGFTDTDSVAVYQEAAQEDYSKMPMTFEILSAGTIIWKATNTSIRKSIQYSLNGSTWTTITSSTGGVTIQVSQGDKIQFRGNNSAYGNSSYFNTFSGSTAVFNVYGNIMSLIDSSNYQILNTLTGTYNFYALLRNLNIVDASNLILPAMTITTQCYRNMFAACTRMTKAPAFPATTLANACYMNMLYGCTALVDGPVLPATTLTSQCYQGLFYGCSSLKSITCLATDISANSCTNQWAYGVGSSGTFVKAASMTSWSRGFNGIPNNWTVVDNS